MKSAFVFAAVIVASPAMATEPSVPAAISTAAAPAEPAKVKKVCRNLDPAIGSNLMRRVCKTPEEWAKQKQTERQTTKEQVDVAKFRDMSTQYAAPH